VLKNLAQDARFFNQPEPRHHRSHFNERKVHGPTDSGSHVPHLRPPHQLARQVLPGERQGSRSEDSHFSSDH
jgi:hypothetical protein